jgi:hypothetical protein
MFDVQINRTMITLFLSGAVTRLRHYFQLVQIAVNIAKERSSDHAKLAR